MSRPLNAGTRPDNASGGSTLNDPSSNRLGTSFASNAGSSVISNGSLLDLYARSAGSTANSAGASTSYGISPVPNSPVSPSLQAQQASSDPPPLPARPSDHHTRADALRGAPDPSHSTTLPHSLSEWTGAPLRDAEPIAASKRASVAGFDAEMLKNVRQGGIEAGSWRSTRNEEREEALDEGFEDNDSDGSHYDDDEPLGVQAGNEAVYTGSHDSTYSYPSLSLTAPPAELAEAGSGPTASNSGGSGGGMMAAGRALRGSALAHLGDYGREGSSGLSGLRDPGLASPPVPLRSSSFNREDDPVSPGLGPTTSPQGGLSASGWASPLLDDQDGAASRAASRRPSLALHTSQIPLRRSSSEIRRSGDVRRQGRASTDTSEMRDGLGISSALVDSPDKRSSHHSGSASAGPGRTGSAKEAFKAEDASLRTSGRSDALDAVKEDPIKTSSLDARFARRPESGDSEPNSEEQAKMERELLAGDTSDGPRPKTLKEARERARLRRQQSEAASATAASSSPGDAPALPSKTARRPEQLLGDTPSRNSVDSVDRPSRDPRRLSAKELVPTSRSSTASGSSAPSNYSHSSEMDDVGQLQDPMDFSFNAALDADPAASATTQASGGIEELTAAVSSAMQDLSFGSADDSSNTIYGATAARSGIAGAHDSARNLPPVRAEQDLQTPKPGAPSRFDEQRQQIVSAASSVAQSANRGLGLASPYGDKPLPSADASRSLQSALRDDTRVSEKQRRPVSRIDMYGRTVPMPEAFVSAGITAKRKAAAWERAKLYAQYTNDLLRLETGLELWMDAVQRPAMRQQLGRRSQDAAGTQDDGDFHRGHVRNDGSYAASVRSDMTFPMRGDGGKAKEIASSTLPTMPESPSTVPANLPYPSLVDQRSNPISGASAGFPTTSASQPYQSSQDSSFSHTVGKASGLTSSSSSGNSRSLTGGNFFSSLGRKGSRRAPGSSVSSLAQGGLASIAGAVGGGARGNKAKGKIISAPMQAPERRSIDAPEAISLDTGTYGRSSGLGESASASRLPTVSERQQFAVSAASSPTGPRPGPMGPRAPGSSATHASFSSMGRSNSNDAPRGGPGGVPLEPARTSTDTTYFPGSLSPQIASPDADNHLWSDAGSRPKNGRSGSATSLLASRDSAVSAVRSSFSYGTVRDKMRGAGGNANAGPAAAVDPGFQETLNKLADVLPDADTDTLAHYLRKAKGNDLVAIGDYLQDQSLGRLPG